MNRLLATALAVSLPALAHAQSVPAIQASASASASVSAPADGSAHAAAVPATMPPPVHLLSPSAALDDKEKHAVALAQTWKARHVMPHPGPDGVIRFLYGATLPSIVCAPLQTCDLALQPGEIVNNIDVGDKVRWRITPAVSGTGSTLTTHLNIKPDDAGLVTSLTVYTTRRTYAVKLVATQHEWMPLVGFNYPDDADNAWSSYRQSVAFASASREAGSIQGNAADLDFNFRIGGDHPGWRPVRVYTDGAKTYIEFPRRLAFTTAPALVALTGGGFFTSPKAQMVNYRIEGDRYIVDRVLDRAELVAGVGGDQTKVTISREDR